MKQLWTHTLYFRMQICQTRAWMLSTGFTLAYGAMFSKVWRVHRFTTKQKSDPKVRSSKMCCRSTIWMNAKLCRRRSIFCFHRKIAFSFSLSLSLYFSSSSPFASLNIFPITSQFLLCTIEKSRTMEAVYNGVGIAVRRFSDFVTVAIHRSTPEATWNLSTGEAIIGNWWHSDKSGAGALWKWKPIDLVRYVRMSHCLCVCVCESVRAPHDFFFNLLCQESSMRWIAKS